MMKSIALIESDRDIDYNNIAQIYNITEITAVTLWRLGYGSLLMYLNPDLLLRLSCRAEKYCYSLN